MARPRVHNGEKQLRVRTRDPTAPSRWDYWRRTHSAWNTRAWPGQADGCKEARKQMLKWLLQCRRPTCGALVTWWHAKIDANKTHGNTKANAKQRRAARARGKAKPTPLRQGAGCGNPCCARSRHPSRFKTSQRALAHKLAAGDGILVEWPTSAEDTDVWRRPALAVQAAIARALELST